CLFQNVPLLFAICLGASLVCLRMRTWKRMVAVFGIGALSVLSLAPYLPIITAYQNLNVIIRTTVSSSWILVVLAYTLAAGTGFFLFGWFVCCAVAVVAVSYLISAEQKGSSDKKSVNLAIFSLTVLVSGIAAFIVFTKEAGLQVHPWHYVPIFSLIAVSIEVF